MNNQEKANCGAATTRKHGKSLSLFGYGLDNLYNDLIDDFDPYLGVWQEIPEQDGI